MEGRGRCVWRGECVEEGRGSVCGEVSVCRREEGVCVER